MKIKKFLMLVFPLLLTFMLVACNGENVEQPNDGVSEDETEENLKSEETEEDSDDTTEADSEDTEESTGNLGKRSNPVPVGEWIEFQDRYYESIESQEAIDGRFKLRMTEIERGDAAFDQLVSDNQFNEPAPDGNEWIIVNFEMEMLDGDEDVPYTVVPFISVMASTGNEVSQDDWGTLDGNEFGHVDLFPGGTHSGRISKYIPVEDESLLVYEVGFDTGIYFSITE